MFIFVQFVFVTLENNSLKIFLRKVCFRFFECPLWWVRSRLSLSLSLSSLSLSVYLSFSFSFFLSICFFSLSLFLSLSLSLSLGFTLTLTLALALARFVPVTVGVGVRATHFLFFCPWRQSHRGESSEKKKETVLWAQWNFLSLCFCVMFGSFLEFRMFRLF